METLLDYLLKKHHFTGAVLQRRKMLRSSLSDPKGLHTTPLQPTWMQNQKISRLDISHHSLCIWSCFTMLAKHIPNLKVFFLAFAILQGKQRAPRSPQQADQRHSNWSNLLALGIAISMIWELFHCRWDPPGYKHWQDADCQHTFIWAH